MFIHELFQLDAYFSDTLAELRAAAGLSAVEIDANEPFGMSQYTGRYTDI